MNWLPPGPALWVLSTEEAAFPFLLGKESGPSKVAEDLDPGLQRQKDRGRGQEGTLWRCPTVLRGGCRAQTEPDSAQLCSPPRRPRDAGGRELGCLPPVADPQWHQLPWLHPKPVHQQRAAGLHQDEDEARRGARLRALPEALLPAWHLPAQRHPGACVPL